MASTRSEAGVDDALSRLDAYLRATKFVGYDPYDTLRSPLFRALGRTNRQLAQVVAAAGRLSPINIRPMLGIYPSRNAKATSLLLRAMVLRKSLQPDSVVFGNRVARFEQELRTKAIPFEVGVGWGYDFPWANRSFAVPTGTPNAVVTAFVLEALSKTPKPDADLIDQGVRFLRGGLRWQRAPETRVSYTPYDERDVVNVQALVAKALVTLGRDEDRSVGVALARRVMTLQAADGSWVYGTARSDRFIDLYHSGFILRSLADIERVAPELNASESIARGLDFVATELIGDEGQPLPGPGRRFPLDVHAWAEAVLLGVAFRRPELPKVLAWGLANLQTSRGYFAYQKGRHYTLRTPYLRWSQAWAYLALSAVEHSESQRT